MKDLRVSMPAGIRQGILWSCLLLISSVANATVITLGDRSGFTAAVASRGLALSADDFSSYAMGNIANGESRGAFTYAFDSSATQPAIVSDGSGAQVLGGAPYGVFVQGDIFTIVYDGSNLLAAIGIEFVYAPSFDAVPAATYGVTLDAGGFRGNLSALDSAGGSFFVGLLSDDTTTDFSHIEFSVQVPLDADGNPILVPAYQVESLLFAPAASTPEPPMLALMGLSLVMAIAGRARGGLFSACRRRRSAR
jgi:xanthosine utilization system XapX-like protein